MKIVTTFCLMMAMVFAAKAQAQTFTETVAYIKHQLEDAEAISRYSENILTYNSQFNFCPIADGEVSIDTTGGVKVISGVDKIRHAAGRSGYTYQPLKFNLAKILKIERWSGNYIQFFITDNSFYAIEAATQVDAERLTKAFNHLKTLLPKDNDPFAN